ncbi:MAG TPA: hypothetical protein PLE82_05100, partial [Saccharofermentans sp.]|nr:hypothetical protein [Saccharofermentans sp.]
MEQAYLFNKGEDYQVYNYLGSHPYVNDSGEAGFIFRVWAPKAISINVIGDFNEWSTDSSP